MDGKQGGEAVGQGQGDQFVIARNPDAHTRLPYLVRLPVTGAGDVLLATQGMWPSGKDLYCHPVDVWPAGADVIETVDVERSWRSGAAVHLILRRRRARRSLFVWTEGRGRTLIFWRSQTSMRKSRPGVRVPQAMGLERAMTVAVDVRERYPWRFARRGVETVRRELPVGDYAVLAGDHVVAAVERKTPADLAQSAIGGSLTLVLAELSRSAHGAVVVEGRLSDLIKEGQRGGVRSGWLLNVVAALQVAHPGVAWMFAETRALAEDYAYRWLAASANEERKRRGDPAFPGDATPATDAGPQVRDALERRTIALREAARGVIWTTATFAAHCQVSHPTAWKDLRALVADGLLVVQGAHRDRRYRAPP